MTAAGAAYIWPTAAHRAGQEAASSLVGKRGMVDYALAAIEAPAARRQSVCPHR